MRCTACLLYTSANNPSISGETKAYVRSRVEALGVDAKTTAAVNRDTVLDAANDAATAFADDLRTRSRLPGVIAGAPLKSTVRDVYKRQRCGDVSTRRV